MRSISVLVNPRESTLSV